jgi:hypothetical protein
VGELNQFHADTSTYLKEFKIKEKVVEEAVAKADGHLRRLKAENREFKTIVFNGKIIEFNNCSQNIGSDILGSFSFKNVGSYMSFQGYSFSNALFKNHKKCCYLFMNEYGTNFAFYINTDNHLSLVCYNNGGQIIQLVPNALESPYSSCSLISSLKVTESKNNFIIHVRFMNFSGYRVIRGHVLGAVNNCPCLMFMLDKNLAYSKHTFNITAEDMSQIAANNSSILMVDRFNKYSYLNMNLDPIFKKSWNIVKTYIGHTFIDVLMNDQYVFVLSTANKLLIIEVNSGEVVREIDTSADQIKLASTEYIVLFSQLDRITHVYEQAGEFRKLDEIHGRSLQFNGCVTMTRDSSNAFALFDLNGLCYMELN